MSEMDMRAFPGRTHRYVQVPVLYPFGHGLSYTTWNYSGLETEVHSLGDSRLGVNMSVMLQNTGKAPHCFAQRQLSWKRDLPAFWLLRIASQGCPNRVRTVRPIPVNASLCYRKDRF